MDFNGRSALITGASAGIGREFATRLHALGCSVTLVARRKERLEELAHKLNAERNGSASVLAADLSETSDLAALREHIRDNRIDILVSNAGFGSFGHFELLDLANEIKMVRVNIEAGISLIHAVIPQMLSRKDGVIIVLSSMAAFQPLSYMATYSATKAFNFSHALALHSELKPHGIRVLAVCPGPVATEFGEQAKVPDKFMSGSLTSEQTVRKSLKALRQGRAYVVMAKGAPFLRLAMMLPVAFRTSMTSKIMRRRWGAGQV